MSPKAVMLWRANRCTAVLSGRLYSRQKVWSIIFSSPGGGATGKAGCTAWGGSWAWTGG